MVAAKAARPTTWQQVKRGEALSALKRAAPALGIPQQVIALVDYLVGRTRDVDWAEGGRPLAWPSNATLQDVLGIGRTQVKTLIRVGLEHGLFEMDESPNGQRYGHREDGRIVEAYGFDLAPLAARTPELEQIAAAHQERRREGRRMRSRITSLRNRVLAIAEAGGWPALAQRAMALAARRGEERDPRSLAPILAALEALRDEAEAKLLADAACGLAVETDPKGSEDRPSITPTNNLLIAKANTADAGPNRPLAHEESRNLQSCPNGQSHQADNSKMDRREGTASALRGFVVTPDLILKVAPQFRDWVGSSRPRWPELEEAATFVRSDLGISLHAWGQACCAFGRMEAVSVLAAISARQMAGEVRSPGALLRRMTELHLGGELRLDRTFFGLLEKIMGKSGKKTAALHCARPEAAG
jgi:replication initiation protein RepC